MDDELSALNLADDMAEVRSTPDAARWEIELAGALEVTAIVAPLGAPSERFQARLLWGVYPDAAPSLKFRDMQTGRLDVPQAWPVVRGFRPSSLDACVNWCAEGLAIHPEWQHDPNYRWDPQGNPLLRVLRTLQEELDDSFSGRQP